MLKTLSGALLDFVFPPHCHVCRSFIPGSGRLHICDSCREQIRPIAQPHCTICAIPFLGAGANHPCGDCISTPPSFDIARSALIYDGPARELIHGFKYDYKTHLRRPLAFLTAETLSGFVSEQKPDILLPVPLHVRRLRSRGFNQAVLIGELLASEWRIPMERRVLQRIRWTEPQINLAASQRKDNVKGAFAVTDAGAVKDRSVLLLDDVYTTGSTVEECSRILKKNGAEKVVVVTVARTVV